MKSEKTKKVLEDKDIENGFAREYQSPLGICHLCSMCVNISHVRDPSVAFLLFFNLTCFGDDKDLSGCPKTILRGKNQGSKYFKQSWVKSTLLQQLGTTTG